MYHLNLKFSLICAVAIMATACSHVYDICYKTQNKKTITIYCKPDSVKQGVSCDIPSPNSFSWISGGEGDYVYVYGYSSPIRFRKSAILYCQSPNNPYIAAYNKRNIRETYGDSIYWRRYCDDYAVLEELHTAGTFDSAWPDFQPDTILLAGENNKLAWKEIYIKDAVIIGYVNIPLKRKDLFDECLGTLRAIVDTEMVIDPCKQRIESAKRK